MTVHFTDDHPLSVFNRDFYLESGKETEKIYIFRFERKGAQIVINTQNKKEPFAIVYPLIFDDKYNWRTNTAKRSTVITGLKLDDILQSVKKELEFIKYGNKNNKRKDS